jgi:hypothetical protein
MARRTFDVVDVTEILAHWCAGRSKREMDRLWAVRHSPEIDSGHNPQELEGSSLWVHIYLSRVYMVGGRHVR